MQSAASVPVMLQRMGNDQASAKSRLGQSEVNLRSQRYKQGVRPLRFPTELLNEDVVAVPDAQQLYPV